MRENGSATAQSNTSENSVFSAFFVSRLQNISHGYKVIKKIIFFPKPVWKNLTDLPRECYSST